MKKDIFVFALVLVLLGSILGCHHWVSKSLFTLPSLPSESTFLEAVSVQVLENPEINEASGLAFSQVHTGVLYTHNDSGAEPIVHMIDTLGRSLGQIFLQNVKNRDWEDIAVGSGPDKTKSYVYVAEIGDNLARYKEIRVFRFAEPEGIQTEIQLEPEVLVLSYPDGPKDAETLMVDPLSGDIFILSKRDSLNILYKTSQKAFKKGKATLERVMVLPFTMAVAGDISMDGSQILIKNYEQVFYWIRMPNETVDQALSRQPEVLPYKPEPQGEAIAFHPNGNSYFTVSEKSNLTAPMLYRYFRR